MGGGWTFRPPDFDKKPADQQINLEAKSKPGGQHCLIKK